MRYHTLLASIVSLGVLGACTDRQTSPTAVTGVLAQSAAAATPAERTEFEGYVHYCGSTPPEELMVTPGGTVHLRAGNQNQWVTGNSLIDGFEENASLVNVNLNNGTGAAHLDVTLRPDAVNGTWEIRQTVNLRGGALAGGQGVGHGTGALHGMTITYSTEPGATAPNPCNSELGSSYVRGVITAPGSGQ